MKITVGDIEKVLGVYHSHKRGFYKVTVLSHNLVEGEIQSVQLCDKNQLIISFPVSIFKANAETIPEIGEVLSISPQMYDTWFSQSIHLSREEYSEIIKNNFDKILEHSSLILSNKAYFNLRMPWLVCHMAYAGSASYCLGSILQSWISETTFYLKDEGLYMINISGSPLSGAHSYTAWSRAEKKFVTGSLNREKYGTWRNFFLKFHELGRQYVRHNSSDIKAMQKLIQELKIDPAF